MGLVFTHPIPASPTSMKSIENIGSNAQSALQKLCAVCVRRKFPRTAAAGANRVKGVCADALV